MILDALTDPRSRTLQHPSLLSDRRDSAHELILRKLAAPLALPARALANANAHFGTLNDLKPSLEKIGEIFFRVGRVLLLETLVACGTECDARTKRASQVADPPGRPHALFVEHLRHVHFALRETRDPVGGYFGGKRFHVVRTRLLYGQMNPLSLRLSAPSMRTALPPCTQWWCQCNPRP